MRPPALPLLALCLVLCAAACSEGETPDGVASDAEPEFQPCAYVSAEEVAEVTGIPLVQDREVTAPSMCSFVFDAGPTGVTVQVHAVPTRVEFDALLPVDVETTDLEVDSADEAHVWTTAETIQEGIVRAGGSAARVSIIWDEPPSEYDGLLSLMTTVASSLPEAEFVDAEPPGSVTCVSFSLDELRAALALPDLQASPAGLSTACAVSDASSGVNLLIDLPEGAAGQEQLNLDGRTSEIDGETYKWTVEAVPEVGDGALWTLDPVSERSGELVALFGDQLVRVTSSANEPGEDIKLRAVAAALVAAGANTG